MTKAFITPEFDDKINQNLQDEYIHAKRSQEVVEDSNLSKKLESQLPSLSKEDIATINTYNLDSTIEEVDVSGLMIIYKDSD